MNAHALPRHEIFPMKIVQKENDPLLKSKTQSAERRPARRGTPQVINVDPTVQRQNAYARTDGWLMPSPKAIRAQKHGGLHPTPALLILRRHRWGLPFSRVIRHHPNAFFLQALDRLVTRAMA